MLTYLNLLKEQFNNRINFIEKRPGIMQLIAPFYHEDGDMIDIFIEESPEPGKIRICDHGMTLMRLTYSINIDTPYREQIFEKIISENGAKENEGNIYIDTLPEFLNASVFQFSQVVAKVSNMNLYKREIIKSLFLEMLDEFIFSNLKEYKPKANYFPIPSRDDLEVNYVFEINPKPVYLFGIKDNTHARLATISCLEFQRVGLSFKSVAVHEDFETLSKKDRKRITNVIDKQFTSLDEFKENAKPYFERESA